jgi:hypothetical protein
MKIFMMEQESKNITKLIKKKHIFILFFLYHKFSVQHFRKRKGKSIFYEQKII